MNILRKSTLAVAISTMFLNGCIAFSKDEIEEAMDKNLETVKKIKTSKNYVIVDRPFITFEVEEQEASTSVFDTVKVDMSSLGQGATLQSVIEMFQKKKLNVIAQADLVLNAPVLHYAVKEASAKRALDMITHDLGMGYKIIDEESREPYAIITGLPTLHYTLNVINSDKVIKQFVTNKTKDQSSNLGGSSGGAQGQGGSGGQTGSSGGQTGGDVNSFTVTSTIRTDFWKDLEEYLKSLLIERVKVSKSAGNTITQANGHLSQDNGGFIQSSGFETEERTVGSVSLNPGTGYISITAPKHKLEEIEDYLKHLDLQMNSRIIYKGKILANTHTEQENKGLDVSALSDYCTGEFSCVVSNNIYNNISITDPGQNTWFNAAADRLTGSSLLGLRGSNQAWQVFNAYTKDHSNVRIIDTFEGPASHGIEATFTENINNVNQRLSTPQTTTTDGVTSSGGTQNELIPYRTGLIVTIFPSLDTKTGVVKSIVDVKLSLPGTREVITQIAEGEAQNGTYQNVNDIEFQVSPIIRSGELVIAAGKTSMSLRDNEGGTTELKDSWFGGLFGKSSRTKLKTTYYVLLQAQVIPPLGFQQ